MHKKINLIWLCLLAVTSTYSYKVEDLIKYNNTKIWNKYMHVNEDGYRIKYNTFYKSPFRSGQIKVLRDLFINNFNQGKAHNPIPKYIHQIWLGDKPIPKIYTEFSKSWQENHPDWKYKLWTDKDLPSLKLKNQEVFDKVEDVREKADILRYELLYTIGGLYVDMDFKCLKPLDKLHFQSELYAGIQPNDTYHLINNALIATIPNHPVMEACVKNISKYQDKDILHERTGPEYFTHCFFEAYRKSKNHTIIYPVDFFYGMPYSSDLKTYLNLKSDINFAVHIWGNKNNILK